MVFLSQVCLQGIVVVYEISFVLTSKKLGTVLKSGLYSNFCTIMNNWQVSVLRQ